MAAQYTIGMRYRFHRGEVLFEGTFDGYNTGPNNTTYCRWANVMVLTALTDTPPGTSQHVPKSDTHRTPVG